MNRQFRWSFSILGLVILVAVIIASMSIDARAASEDPVPPRLIYGEVQFDGTIRLGNGFSVDHIDDGYYKLTFTDASGSPYNPKICIASPINNQCSAAVLQTDISLSGQIEVKTGYVPNFEPDNCGFSFICIK